MSEVPISVYPLSGPVPHPSCNFASLFPWSLFDSPCVLFSAYSQHMIAQTLRNVRFCRQRQSLGKFLPADMPCRLAQQSVSSIMDLMVNDERFRHLRNRQQDPFLWEAEILHLQRFIQAKSARSLGVNWLRFCDQWVGVSSDLGLDINS